jgi:dihydroorotate dehydrogenase
MHSALASALMPVLRRFEPERAHRLALLALRLGLAGRDRSVDDPVLATQALGLRFTNPIGLAAGFDKDAVAARGLARLGFGFIETGTVTPQPQPGNPRPRLFRLAADRAIINRLGFNNGGLEMYCRRLRAGAGTGIPIGANLGINKSGADPERDYPALIAAVAPFVQYVVVNVSSPNTPGLRELQQEARLRDILAAVAERVPSRPPLLLKIAPDLEPGALEALVDTCIHAGVEGLVVSNTTVSRPAGLHSPHAGEAGGLSGAPLRRLATAVLARAHLLANGRLCLVGLGGVFSGRDALEKIQAGASLVQLFTSFAYVGPALIPRIKAELAVALRGAGFSRLRDAIGTDAERLAGGV